MIEASDLEAATEVIQKQLRDMMVPDEPGGLAETRTGRTLEMFGFDGGEDMAAQCHQFAISFKINSGRDLDEDDMQVVMSAFVNGLLVGAVAARRDLASDGF